MGVLGSPTRRRVWHGLGSVSRDEPFTASSFGKISMGVW